MSDPHAVLKLFDFKNPHDLALELDPEWTDPKSIAAVRFPKPGSHAEKRATPPWKRNDDLMAFAPGGGSTIPPGAGVMGQPRLDGNGPVTSKVASYNQFPFCTTGLLLADLGGEIRGSAWAVSSRVVVTAGHCVVDDTTKQVAARVSFVPHYRGGPAANPFDAVKLAVPSGWCDSLMNDYDIAAVLLDRDLPGDVGALACSPVQPADAILGLGYPTQDDPNAMYGSLGRVLAANEPAMHNDLGGGASGGPWIAWTASGLFAVGLNSHHEADSTVMMSPLFGEALSNILSWASAV